MNKLHGLGKNVQGISVKQCKPTVFCFGKSSAELWGLGAEHIKLQYPGSRCHCRCCFERQLAK